MASNNTQSTVARGSVSTLPSGFYKFHANSSSDLAVPAGQSMYGLTLTGTTLFLKPVGARSPLLLSAAGNPPAASVFQYNWISVVRPTYDSINDPSWGFASITTSGGTWPGGLDRYALDGGFLDHVAFSLTNSNGALTGSYVGAAGENTIALDFGPNQGGIYGIVSPGSTIGISNLLNGEYRGIASINGLTCAVYLRNLGGELVGNTYVGGDSGIDSDAESNDPTTQISIQFLLEPTPGQIRASVNAGSDFFFTQFVAGTVDGKYVIVGLDDVGNNIVLVQQ